MSGARFVLCVVTGLGVAGCASLEKPPPPPIQVRVTVESDPGKPLPGATILRENRELGVTSTDGTVIVPLRGREGDTVDLTVRCPATEYQSPAKPIAVVLHRTSEAKVAEYRALCPPLYRNVVVAVRAENGPNLPVMYLGQMYARTDASGAAHFMVRVRPYEQFDVTLSTTEKGNEGLRPQNPAKAFVVKSQDEVMFFDQRFQLEKKPVYAKPVGPRPI
ncbi:MAG: hypothetical protein JNL38_24205 [Myxococcales bacterium]|jgi:hypothetical protein|nr:hypothetical protein [Myxococcales bacterium]